MLPTAGEKPYRRMPCPGIPPFDRRCSAQYRGTDPVEPSVRRSPLRRRSDVPDENAALGARRRLRGDAVTHVQHPGIRRLGRNGTGADPGERPFMLPIVSGLRRQLHHNAQRSWHRVAYIGEAMQTFGNRLPPDQGCRWLRVGSPVRGDPRLWDRANGPSTQTGRFIVRRPASG
jgi:hypothetical protein